MTRIAEHLTFQALDDGAAVLVDDRSGTEIVIPDLDTVRRLADTANYFYTAGLLARAEQSAAQ